MLDYGIANIITLVLCMHTLRLWQPTNSDKQIYNEINPKTKKEEIIKTICCEVWFFATEFYYGSYMLYYYVDIGPRQINSNNLIVQSSKANNSKPMEAAHQVIKNSLLLFGLTRNN